MRHRARIRRAVGGVFSVSKSPVRQVYVRQRHQSRRIIITIIIRRSKRRRSIRETITEGRRRERKSSSREEFWVVDEGFVFSASFASGGGEETTAYMRQVRTNGDGRRGVRSRRASDTKQRVLSNNNDGEILSNLRVLERVFVSGVLRGRETRIRGSVRRVSKDRKRAV